MSYRLSIPPAPSAAPTSVRISDGTSSNITVQWGAVDCIDRNGDITGYSVRYGVQGNRNTQYLNVSGGSITEATISSLMPSTTYSIQVAAVNSAGIGVYSGTVKTDGESYQMEYDQPVTYQHLVPLTTKVDNTHVTYIPSTQVLKDRVMRVVRVVRVVEVVRVVRVVMVVGVVRGLQ